MPRKLTKNEQAIVDGLSPAHRAPIKAMLIAQQSALDALQRDRQTTKTGIIHHYTDQPGLEGITGYGTLFLNDYTTMPDTGEIEYGLGVGWGLLREEYEEGMKTGRLRRFVAGTEAIGRHEIAKLFRGYILSFTPNGDASHQWSDYAEKSAGYCLGFDGKELDRAFVAFTKSKGLDASGSFEVLYDEKRLRQHMRKYVRNALEAVKWLKEGPGYRGAAALAMKEIGVNLVFAFIFTALYFKHPSYAAEREYRYFMMTLPDKEIGGLSKGKNRRGQCVGRFLFDWKSGHAGALKLIKIGPAQDEATGRKIVGKALTNAGLSVNVEMSKMPPIRR